MNDLIKEKISSLFSRIKYEERLIKEAGNRIDEYKQRINNIAAGVVFHPLAEDCLRDISDQTAILMDMYDVLPPYAFGEQLDKLDSLFFHVDNIRYYYNLHKLECPRWYRAKYGDKIRPDEFQDPILKLVRGPYYQ